MTSRDGFEPATKDICRLLDRYPSCHQRRPQYQGMGDQRLLIKVMAPTARPGTISLLPWQTSNTTFSRLGPHDQGH
ncbi:hypothetical protein PoB_004004700 [Plakobranchus ocellatus]|uniref:Uncharacterized protein n=1 Tax=Plakobranchus ocellatus TaxID=259542 RepID=A0AAV4B2U7_9GAST|nr:hypothetical protein PoB_004004700 [Plakobranchus ocellatus]